MRYKYNIIYFHSENTPAIVLKSSNDETFFKEFDGIYLEDNLHTGLELVEETGHGFFKAEIIVEYWIDGELSDIRIHNIEPIKAVFDLPQPPKEE